MEEPERVVLDEMDTPGGHLVLVAYRGQGGVWIGVDRDGSGSMGAIELHSGSIEPQVTGAVHHITAEWGLAWGAVAPGIVRAEFRNEEDEAFPATLVALPTDLEPEYRAVWGRVERSNEICELLGYDEDGMMFDQEDPHPSGPPPSDLDRLVAIRHHAHDSLRYYATAYLNESDDNRERILGHLHTVANVMALFEAKTLDTRSMLARRSKIVTRYLEDAEVDPWAPPAPNK